LTARIGEKRMGEKMRALRKDWERIIEVGEKVDEKVTDG